MSLFGPSAGSKGTYCPISYHCVRDLIGCNHLGHSSPFLQNDGMILGVVQLDISPLATTVICAVTRLYMQPLRQSLIISVQGFSHYIHSYPQQNKRSMGLNSFIGLWRDDLSLDGADQLIQLEEIFHSPVGERCMVLKNWRLLPSCLSNLCDSLSKPNLLSQLGEGATLLNSLPNIGQHVHFPFLHRFKDQIFGLCTYSQWHYLGELGILLGYQGHSIRVI